MPKESLDIPFLTDYNRERGIPLSVATKANGFIFLSGLGPIDYRTGETVRGTIEKQTAASLDAISYVLERAGSSLDDVVNARIYVANAGYYDVINAVYGSYFAKQPPSRTFVTVASWFNTFDIEIEVIAVESSSATIQPID